MTTQTPNHADKFSTQTAQTSRMFRIAVLLFASLLVFQVGIGLLLTIIAHRTNTVGLAWAALFFWLLSVGVAGFAFRRKLPPTVLAAILVASILCTVLLYLQIGYSLIGWRGLNKP